MIQLLSLAIPCSSPWQRLGKEMWLTQDPAVRAGTQCWHDSCLLMLCLMLLQSMPLCYPGTAAFPANPVPAWQEDKSALCRGVCRSIAGLTGTYKEEPYGEVKGQQIKTALGEVSSQHKKEFFYSHSLKQPPLGHSKSPCWWKFSRCDMVVGSLTCPLFFSKGWSR